MNWAKLAEKRKAAGRAKSARPALQRPKKQGLAEEVFELDARAGFGIPIFDDDGAGEGEPPFFADWMGNGAGAWNNNRVFGDDERPIVGSGVDGIANEVINRNGAVQNRAGSENGTALDDGAFVNAGVAADKHPVYND